MRRGRSHNKTSSLLLRKIVLMLPEDTLPDVKWQEIQDLEERDNMILEIREEIINNCLETCYNKYVDKQIITFAVHCSYLSWLKIVDLYFLQHDPGNSNWQTNPKWLPDEEIPPSDPDTWITTRMTVLEDIGSPRTNLKPLLSQSSLVPEEVTNVEPLDAVSSFSLKEFQNAENPVMTDPEISQVSVSVKSLSFVKEMQSAVCGTHPLRIRTRYCLGMKRSHQTQLETNSTTGQAVASHLPVRDSATFE